jgi:hypothetical protein
MLEQHTTEEISNSHCGAENRPELVTQVGRHARIKTIFGFRMRCVKIRNH